MKKRLKRCTLAVAARAKTRLPRSAWRVRCALGILACISPSWATAAQTTDRACDCSIALYWGRHTDSNWRDSLLGEADLVNARLWALAFSRTFYRPTDRAWSFEWEGNAARHYGDQDHWEFNALVTVRWERFPWSRWLATTAAFGLGPSYAMAVPRVEVTHEGDSRRLMLYWQLDVTAAPPGANWAAMARLHHRSTAYGVFGRTGGGNVLTMGVKYLF